MIRFALLAAALVLHAAQVDSNDLQELPEVVEGGLSSVEQARVKSGILKAMLQAEAMRQR